MAEEDGWWRCGAGLRLLRWRRAGLGGHAACPGPCALRLPSPPHTLPLTPQVDLGVKTKTQLVAERQVGAELPPASCPFPLAAACSAKQARPAARLWPCKAAAGRWPQHPQQPADPSPPLPARPQVLVALIGAVIGAGADEQLGDVAGPFARGICRHFAMLFAAGAQVGCCSRRCCCRCRCCCCCCCCCCRGVIPAAPQRCSTRSVLHKVAQVRVPQRCQCQEMIALVLGLLQPPLRQRCCRGMRAPQQRCRALVTASNVAPGLWRCQRSSAHQHLTGQHAAAQA